MPVQVLGTFFLDLFWIGFWCICFLFEIDEITCATAFSSPSSFFKQFFWYTITMKAIILLAALCITYVAAQSTACCTPPQVNTRLFVGVFLFIFSKIKFCHHIVYHSISHPYSQWEAYSFNWDPERYFQYVSLQSSTSLPFSHSHQSWCEHLL